MVDRISAWGAKFVLSQKGIDDMVQHRCIPPKEGIIAVKRIKESDMSKLSEPLGRESLLIKMAYLKMILALQRALPSRKRMKIETDKWVFIEGCKNPKSVLILTGSDSIKDSVQMRLNGLCMTH